MCPVLVTRDKYCGLTKSILRGDLNYITHQFLHDHLAHDMQLLELIGQ